MLKHLLIVYHSKTGNTEALARAAYEGATDELIEAVDVRMLRTHDAGPEDLLWADALLQVKLSALRVETTSVFDFAIGTGQDDFIVPELTAVTAENYSVAGKYDRNISDRFFWYAAVGWLILYGFYDQVMHVMWHQPLLLG